MEGISISYSIYLKRKKTLTFARVFTNIEPANAYQNLFKDLFCCVEKDIGETFNFYHIHEKRLGCIIAEQHKGQALGKLKRVFFISSIILLPFPFVSTLPPRFLPFLFDSTLSLRFYPSPSFLPFPFIFTLPLHFYPFPSFHFSLYYVIVFFKY